MTETKREPKHETYLAAELAQCAPPVKAAKIAVELCQLGRAYFATAQRLCGGEREWGRWSDRVEKLQARSYAQQAQRLLRARGLVAELRGVQIDESCLRLECRTTIGRGDEKREFTTVLL